MKKAAKAAKKAGGKKEPSSDDLRQKAAEHRAHGRMYEAKADMMDVKNPPKRDKNKTYVGGY